VSDFDSMAAESGRVEAFERPEELSG